MVGIVQNRISKIINHNNDDLTEKIKLLYKNCFKIDFNIRIWEEWYKKNPLGEVEEYIYCNHDNIIAYNYFFPQFCDCHKVYLSGGSMVNPNFRGEFIPFMEKLQEKFIADIKCDLIYGFPNKNAYPIFVSKFGFNWQENTNYKLLNLTKIKSSIKSLNIKFKKSDLSSLKISNEQLASLGRNVNWIKWRLHKPETSYFVIEKSNKYIVYKIFDSKVDLITILNCTKIDEYVELLSKFYNYIKSKGFREISLIVSNNLFFYKLSSVFEFEVEDYERHLSYKILTDEIKINNNEMFLEMIDSDVF